MRSAKTPVSEMDAIEAATEVMALWASCFKEKERPAWRDRMLQEFSGWERSELVRVIAKAKATLNGKRMSLEKLCQLRAELGGGGGQAVSATGYMAATEQWLDDVGLRAAYENAGRDEQSMIRRLVAVMMLTPGWQVTLERAAGDPEKFQPFHRISNLVYAANKATTPGRKGKLLPACHIADRDGRWHAPQRPMAVTLPPPPRAVSEAENRKGVDRILAIAAKNGGLRHGNFSRIAADPEYQAYLADYEKRMGGMTPVVVYAPRVEGADD